MHGSGRNGKGVYARTMTSILGQENTARLDIQEFDGNRRFSTERLYGKLVNFSSEPSINKILQTSLMKKLTGQDLIEAEIKRKQKRIKFYNCAKMIILANRFPKIDDDSIAFKDRMTFISFPNMFLGDDQIPNIEQTWLNDPLERMGILNWMIKGYQRLQTNGKFTESKTQNETQIAFMRHSDSISAYFKEIVYLEKISVKTRSEFYDLYKLYCDTFDLKVENVRRFTQKVMMMKGVSECKHNGVRAWKGVNCRSIDEDGQIVEVKRTDSTQRTLDTPSPEFEVKYSE